MRISSDSIEKVTVVLAEPKRVLKAFCIGPVNNPVENDYFNDDLNKIFLSEDTIIKEKENVVLKSGEQYEVFYIDKTDEFGICIDFSEYNFNDNQRFFIFTNVYSNNTKKTVLRFGRNCRMKVWLNNTLIFNGHPNDKESDCIITKLNEGNNLVLAEYLPAEKGNSAGFSIRCVFRTHPDTDSGNIRTAFRNYPDSITAHPDTLSR